MPAKKAKAAFQIPQPQIFFVSPNGLDMGFDALAPKERHKVASGERNEPLELSGKMYKP